MSDIIRFIHFCLPGWKGTGIGNVCKVQVGSGFKRTSLDDDDDDDNDAIRCSCRHKILVHQMGSQ